MESLQSLKSRLKEAERELERLTVKKSGDTPWAHGVQDQFKSHSYSYEEYTDPKRARELKDEISSLQYQIDTYAQRARAEREKEEDRINREINKYQYVSAGKVERTSNPAIAARYDAQHRFFGKSKLEQALLKLTGQNRKFHKLWNKAATDNKAKQEEIARELNKLFR